MHTVAGWPTTFSGDGVAATSAQFFNIRGLSADKNGVLYIADTGNHRIRRVLSNGIVETVAGTGEDTFSGDNGPARAAGLSGPEAVLPAADGRIYIADTQNHRIRAVGPDGVIRTIAGTGRPGFGGDGGSALLAQINSPRGMALDSSGTLYFADSRNNRIRAIAADGVIRTVAGSGLWNQNLGLLPDNKAALAIAIAAPMAVAVDSTDNLYVPQAGGLIRIDSQGLAHARSFFVDPRWTAMVVDRDDSLLVLGDGVGVNRAVKRLSPDGALTTVAEGSFDSALTLGSEGQIYVTLVRADSVGKLAAGSSQPELIAGVSAYGNTGDDGPALRARFRTASGIAVGLDGSVYVSDQYDNRVRRIGPDNVIRAFAGTGESKTSGDAGPAVKAQLRTPLGLAADKAGNIYIAESGGGRVRMVKPDGAISTVLGGGSTDVITISPPPFPSVAATNALISNPSDLGVAPDGSLFVLAYNRSLNTAGVLRLTADGQVTQIYRQTSSPFRRPAASMTLDPAGNVYLDGVKILADGTTMPDPAFGKNESVYPSVFDSDGNRYILRESRVGKVTKEGVSGIVYNSDLRGFKGEVGLDSAEQHFSILAAATDASGNLFLGDDSGRTRKLEARSCQAVQRPIVKGFGTAWPRSSLERIPAWLAPGSLISLYGEGIGPDSPQPAALDADGKVSTKVGGVRVLLNGTPAPLLYVSARQVNAIAPFSVLRDRVLMELEWDGVKSDAIIVSAVPAALSAHPTITNEDGTVNSPTNRARPGSVATMWVSGLGYTDPPGVDGRLAPLPTAKPVLPVSIDSGTGVPFDILYAGNAPGIVEGVMQINFRVPNIFTGFNTARLTAGSDGITFDFYY